MNEEALEDKIAKLREKNKKQKRDLKRFQNENGTRAEEVARINEKLKTLTAELADREKEFADLTDEVKSQKEKNRFTLSQMKGPGASQITDSDDVDMLKIIEKFNSLLNMKNKEIDQNLRDEINYYTKQQNYQEDPDLPIKGPLLLEAIEEDKEDDPENETYARCNITSIKIQRVPDPGSEAKKEEEEEEDYELLNKKKPLTTVFIISNVTTFEDLFKEACNFWGISEPKDYELIDETESAQCDQKQNVEKHFKTRLGNLNQYLLYLRRKISQVVPSQPQKEAIKVGGGQADGKEKDPDFSRPAKREVDYYKEFFSRFVGLKPFIDVDKVRSDERKKGDKTKKEQPLKIDDNHCLVFSAVFFLMIFTIAPFNQERSILDMFYTISSIQKDFGVQNEIFSLSSQTGSYQNIQAKSDYITFLNQTVSASCFFINPGNSGPEHHELLSQNFMIGGLRLYNMRVQNTTCTNVPAVLVATLPCYYPYYSEAVRYTGTLTLQENATLFASYPWAYNWTTFQTAEQLGQKVGFSGLLSSYDGSGYVIDVPKNISQSDFKNFASILSSTYYVAVNTKAAILTFVLYNQAGEIFIYTELLVEKTSNGLLVPNNMTIIPFRRSFRDDSTLRPNHEAYDVLRVLCAVALNIFVVYRVINNGRFDFMYLISYKGVLNILLFVLSYISINWNISLGNDSAAQISMSDLLGSSSYVEMKQLAVGYQKSIFLLGIISALSIARIAAILGAISRFKLIMMSLETAARQILSYALILIPLVIGFTIAGGNLFGVHSAQFNNFRDSFVTLLLFGIGQAPSDIFDQSSSAPLTIVFFTIYYFFTVFFIITVFTGIYIDSYRVVVMQSGYGITQEESKLSDLIEWLLPDIIMKRLKKVTAKIKARIALKREERKKAAEENEAKKRERREERKRERERERERESAGKLAINPIGESPIPFGSDIRNEVESGSRV